MEFGKPEFFCAALLASRNPKRLADFYRNVLGFPLEEEKHDDTEVHYGCEIGDLHFAIHPVENFGGREPGVGSIKLAFEIFDMPAFLKRIEAQGIKPLYEPMTIGLSCILAVLTKKELGYWWLITVFLWQIPVEFYGAYFVLSRGMEATSQVVEPFFNVVGLLLTWATKDRCFK